MADTLLTSLTRKDSNQKDMSQCQANLTRKRHTKRNKSSLNNNEKMVHTSEKLMGAADEKALVDLVEKASRSWYTTLTIYHLFLYNRPGGYSMYILALLATCTFIKRYLRGQLPTFFVRHFYPYIFSRSPYLFEKKTETPS